MIMILCLKNDDIVTTLFEFDNWVWCRSKLSCEKYHFIFLSLIFNISSDLLYSSTQFVILDIKHENFCLEKFFGEREGRGHKFAVLRWIRFFSIFIIIKDSHRQGQGHVHTWRLRRDLGKISPSPILRSKNALVTGITIESWQTWKGV